MESILGRKLKVAGPTHPNTLTRVFLLTWLWSIFAGFYLVAYAFWVPTLFSSLAIVVPLDAVTLIAGFGYLYDGFSTALDLEDRSAVRALPAWRVWRLGGGLLLLSFLSVYIPATGRIVAHWPLDMAITLLAGLVMVAYGLMDL